MTTNAFNARNGLSVGDSSSAKLIIDANGNIGPSAGVLNVASTLELQSGQTIATLFPSADRIDAAATLSPAAGTTAKPPVLFKSGVLTTTPQYGAFEFDGTDAYLTYDVGSPRRVKLSTSETGAFFGSVVSFSVSTTLTAGQLGALLSVDTTAIALALPAVSSVQPGKSYNITAAALPTGQISIVANTTDRIYSGLSTTGLAVIALYAGDSIQLTSDGTKWIASSFTQTFSPTFNALILTTGSISSPAATANVLNSPSTINAFAGASTINIGQYGCYTNLYGGFQATTVAETKASPTISGGGVVLDFSQANVFEINLTSNITSMSLLNQPSSTTVSYAFLIKVNISGTFTIAWPANFRWAYGVPPSLTTTAGRVDTFIIYTTDAGANYFCAPVSQGA